MKKITLLLCLIVPLISVSQALKDENNSELNFYGNEFKLPEMIILVMKVISFNN